MVSSDVEEVAMYIYAKHARIVQKHILIKFCRNDRGLYKTDKIQFSRKGSEMVN